MDSCADCAKNMRCLSQVMRCGRVEYATVRSTWANIHGRTEYTQSYPNIENLDFWRLELNIRVHRMGVPWRTPYNPKCGRGMLQTTAALALPGALSLQ